jgi:hypothetical protein
LSAQYAYNSPYAFSENILIHKVELEGLETAFDIRSRQNDQAFLRGEISRKEWEDFYRGSAMGAAVGVVVFVGVFCPSCAAEITRLGVAVIMTQGAHKMAETTQDPVLLGAQEQGMLEVPAIGSLTSAFGRTLNTVNVSSTKSKNLWFKLFGRKSISTETANAKHLASGKYAPYAEGGAELIKTRKDTKYVRVHGPNNKEGDWLVKESDIMGMSPEDIKDYLGLKYTPTHFTKVSVGRGTILIKGKVAPIEDFGVKGGGTQYEISKGWKNSSVTFSESQPIEKLGKK